MTRIIGFSGSPSPHSRTTALVEEIVTRSADATGGQGHTYDLLSLGPDFTDARAPADLGGPAQKVLNRILEADALVIGTPVYKGSYTGLFKHFFDLIPPEALSGKPVILTATGGGHRHALVIEHQLRPLFGFFEAETIATGIYASREDYNETQGAAPDTARRIARAVGQLSAHLGHAAPAQPAPGPQGLAPLALQAAQGTDTRTATRNGTGTGRPQAMQRTVATLGA